MQKDIFIIKSDGTREKFDTEKLESSLVKAGAPQKVALDIINRISEELTDGMTTKEIYHHAFELLHAKDKPIALTYSLKHAVMELGPSGFPFEKYVAEIFRAQSMDVLTDQIVRGACTEHELDVVAWNEAKLIMVEAKFHNDPAMKSDLKVILYVKARFDDLKTETFNYAGEKRALNEGWLVTNTKFSKTAIEYGMCQGGVVMIGWNYPPKGNLQDMLLQYKLHPITCLTTINSSQKKMLLDQGIVLAKMLPDNSGALALAGVTEGEVQKVFEEVNML